MAFGKGNSQFGDAKAYSFTIKDKDLPSPIFEVKTKGDDGKWTPLKETATRVNGRLTGIRYNEFLYKGAQGDSLIKSAKAVFRDVVEGKHEVYLVDVPFTYLGRNLLNSFLNLKSFGDVAISLYKGKPKKDGPYAGKPGFSSAALYSGKEMVKGRFANNELPVIKKVQLGAKKLSDTTDIDEFFAKQIAELEKVIAAANQAQGDAPSEADQVAAPVEGVPEHLDGPDNDDPAAPPF